MKISQTLQKSSLLIGMLFSLAAMAQTSVPPAVRAAPLLYGIPLNLTAAKKVMEAAEAEAAKNGWTVAVAVVDSASQLVMLHRIDGTQYGSIDIARGKATTAVNFKRETKDLQDVIARGGAGLGLLRIDGLIPLEGGVPIIVDGKIVGAVGVSGMLSWQDAQVATAGASAVR